MPANVRVGGLQKSQVNGRSIRKSPMAARYGRPSMCADPYDSMPSDCQPDMEPYESSFRPAFMTKMDRAWLENEPVNVDSLMSKGQLNEQYRDSRSNVLRDF